jgi:hypothetical protein
MRKVMRKFDACKKAFSNDVNEMHIELPQELHHLNIPEKLFQGQLTITHEQMRKFFDPSVDSVVELIKGQILQVERKKNRVKVSSSLPNGTMRR